MPSTTSLSTRRQFLMVCPTCCLAVARDRSNLESMESLTMPWSPRDCPKKHRINVHQYHATWYLCDTCIIVSQFSHEFYPISKVTHQCYYFVLTILAEWNPRSYLCLLIKRQRILALRWIFILHFSWMCALFIHIHNYTTHNYSSV